MFTISIFLSELSTGIHFLVFISFPAPDRHPLPLVRCSFRLGSGGPGVGRTPENRKLYTVHCTLYGGGVASAAAMA